MQDKNKWYLISSISVIVIGISIIGFIANSGKKAADDNSDKSTVTLRAHTPTLKSSEIRRRLKEAKNYVPPDPIQEVNDIIASHQARIEADPEAPEAPVLLEAMGNLYMLKLNDYAMAAYCYEQLFQRYPKYQRSRTYINLVTALEKMGDEEGVNRICREMRKEFPPDSIEHQWAADKGGIQPFENPQVIHPDSPEEAELIEKQRSVEEGESEASGESAEETAENSEAAESGN